MKTLQQYLTEGLVNEAQYTPADWDKALSQFRPSSTNYSQLGGLESYIEDLDDAAQSEWQDAMINGGVNQVYRMTLEDIFLWVADNYEPETLYWGDDLDDIRDYVKKMKRDKTIWACSEEDYVTFMIPKKKLSGLDKKLGEVVAKYGNSGDFQEIAASRFKRNEDF